MTKIKISNEIPVKISKLSFEESLTELESIVTQLEEGKVSLEESIEIYTRGEQLRNHCESKLRSAKEKIDKIVPAEGGSARQGHSHR